ncbi:MAG TPA: hypothetical protein VHO23_02945 [Candidatus Paceibacterota bacterium]|nr:hypothetical protein [Candidatus Paceibacterota bacterium]
MAPIPQRVRRAQAQGDAKALSAMGRAGGIASGTKRRNANALAQVIAIHRSVQFREDERFRREQANEHICPFDPYD